MSHSETPTPWDKATALHCLNILQEVREQIVHADGVDYGVLSRAEYRLQKFADSLPSEKGTSGTITEYHPGYTFTRAAPPQEPYTATQCSAALKAGLARIGNGHDDKEMKARFPLHCSCMLGPARLFPNDACSDCPNLTPSATLPSIAELLEIIRHNESVDENGDPVGAKPETSWEEGYAAGIRCLYRFLAKTQYVGEKK